MLPADDSGATENVEIVLWFTRGPLLEEFVQFGKDGRYKVKVAIKVLRLSRGLASDFGPTMTLSLPLLVRVRA